VLCRRALPGLDPLGAYSAPLQGGREDVRKGGNERELVEMERKVTGREEQVKE